MPYRSSLSAALDASLQLNIRLPSPSKFVRLEMSAIMFGIGRSTFFSKQKSSIIKCNAFRLIFRLGIAFESNNLFVFMTQTRIPPGLWKSGWE